MICEEMINIKTARVFPRKTKASPDDGLAFFTPPPSELTEIDEVHVSVTFSYDMPKATYLAESWMKTGLTVHMGGPAFSTPGGDFIPGMYLKQGYIITSRGCTNRCWFCSVPAREGYHLRELPITEGWNILDDNLFACSEQHIKAVFDMLSRQPEKPIFTGGLEAKLFEPWHVDLLRESKTKRFYCAYDTLEDYEPLVVTGKLIQAGGITRQSHKACCYVLIGYHGDNFVAAEKRLLDTWAAGFVPYAMLYRNVDGQTDSEWRKFQRLWVRPQILFSRLKEIRLKTS